MPAGLKKVLGQPFTDPQNTGVFHEFLHVFHATGPFYRFVGAVQLLVAVLLMTQRHAPLGALMALPLFTTIAVFCWSTQAFFTAGMVTLMLLGTIALVLWDSERMNVLWQPSSRLRPRSATEQDAQLLDPILWQRCGSAILLFYAAACVLSGGVFRPKGLDFDEPGFYVLPAIALFPVVTWLIERGRRRTQRR